MRLWRPSQDKGAEILISAPFQIELALRLSIYTTPSTMAAMKPNERHAASTFSFDARSISSSLWLALWGAVTSREEKIIFWKAGLPREFDDALQ